MRKLFLGLALLLLVICPFALWGFLIEPDRLVVNRYDLKLRKWSPRLDGLKIVALSDLHAGSNFINEDKIRRIVAETNAQNPDLVFLLGDYIAPSSSDDRKPKIQMPVIADALRDLRARYGIYAILGNIDEAFDAAAVRAELEKAGIRVLSNETASVSINNETLRLLGMRDAMISGDWNEISGELKRVLAADGGDANILVLVHNPDYLRVITGDFSISDRISLVLAGHTHGGQCRFPLIGAPVVPSEYGQLYRAGFIRDQETDMFITTGIGTSKIPVRLGVPPEIAVLTIYAGD